MQKTDVAYFDGACEPCNPGGTGAWGIVLYGVDGNRIHQDAGIIRPKPHLTNNVAEYGAAIKALRAYQNSGRPGPLLLRGDSQMVVKQMNGEWQIGAGAYVKTARHMQKVLGECSFAVLFEWIPRDKNAEADALGKTALAEVGIKPRKWR